MGARDPAASIAASLSGEKSAKGYARTANPRLLVHQLHRPGQKVSPKSHFSATCLFHPPGKQSRAPCFEGLSFLFPAHELSGLSHVVFLFREQEGASSCAFPQTTAPVCSKARLCSSSQSMGDCYDDSPPLTCSGNPPHAEQDGLNDPQPAPDQRKTGSLEQEP